MNIELQPAITMDEDESRNRILDCARELYIEFGMRRTTMEDVAKKVGIGRATLYRRFSDKEQLFQAVILRDTQRDLTRIQEAIRHQSSFLDGLLEAFVLAVGYIHRNPLLSRLLTTEPDNVLPSLTTGFHHLMSFARAYVAAQIKRGQDAGQIRSPLPADATAELLLRLIHSLMLTPQGVIDPADDANLREFAHQFLLPILRV